MPIPPSGPITMEMINTELGYPATQIISLNDTAVRALAQVPAGVISLSNFYGKSSTVTKGLGWGLYSPTVAQFSVLQDFPTDTLTTNTPRNAGAFGQQMNGPSVSYVSSGLFNVTPGATVLNTVAYTYATATYNSNVINAPATRTSSFGGNTPTTGYVLSGQVGATPFSVSAIKFSFSSLTYSPVTNVPAGRLNPVNKFEGSNFIYSVGGNTASPPTAVSLPTLRLEKSNETWSTAPFNSPTPSSTVANTRTIWNWPTASYTGFFNAPAPFSGVYKIIHSSQTATIVAPNPAAGYVQRGAPVNSGTVGFANYARTSGSVFSLRRSFTLSTETYSALPSNTPSVDVLSGSTGGQPIGLAL